MIDELLSKLEDIIDYCLLIIHIVCAVMYKYPNNQ